MKKLLIVLMTVFLITLLTECSSNSEKTSNIETTYLESVTENKTEDEIEAVKEETIEAMTEQEDIEYTEDEYKNLGQELYYDDFFDEAPDVGQYVKFHGFISGKGQYTSSSTFGIVIEDIDNKYNFRKDYLGCCVLHEETKDSAIPSYFGESTYLMFPSESDLLIENYESGQYVVVYGEVVQIWSGIFIIPKYIEEE